MIKKEVKFIKFSNSSKKWFGKKYRSITYTIEEIKLIIKNFKKFNIIMLPYNIIDRRPLKSKIFEN